MEEIHQFMDVNSRIHIKDDLLIGKITRVVIISFGSGSVSGTICFWGLSDPHPDPLVTSMDPAPDPVPDPSIIKNIVTSL